MDEQAPRSGSPEEPQATPPSLALVVHRRTGLPAPLAQVRHLPARLSAQLPALWDGGRGPLARAAVAGGLLALGSVVGRLTAGSSTALVPARPEQRLDPAPRPASRRHLVRFETEISTSSVHRTDGSTGAYRWRRTRVVEEWHASE